jgi:hypothetical protein
LLGKLRGCGALAERQQDLLAAERQHHQRQRDEQRGPQPDTKRAPYHARIACAKGLRRQRGDGGHQAHAEGEADEVDRPRQCRGSDGLVAEPADEGEVGRHHRDLAELRQRQRHRKPQGFGEFVEQMVARRTRDHAWRHRSAFDVLG